MQNSSYIFSDNEGHFLASAEEMRSKLDHIKAFVFDWDGVFNNGEKNISGGSSYNEIDCMGINMLRFSHWLLKKKLPETIIISGEKNQSSFHIASREHFDCCYFKVANKTEALRHLYEHKRINAHEVAFVFDDILDLSIAKECGLRFLVNRPGPSLFRNYVKSSLLADYITFNVSGQYAIREVTELVMGLRGNFSSAIENRMNFSPIYKEYLKERNEVKTLFYTSENGSVVLNQPDQTITL